MELRGPEGGAGPAIGRRGRGVSRPATAADAAAPNDLITHSRWLAEATSTETRPILDGKPGTVRPPGSAAADGDTEGRRRR